VAAAGLRLWASVIGWRLRVGSTAGCEVRLTAHAGWPGRARLGRARAGPAWHVPGLLKHICLSLWTAAAVSIDWRLGHAAVTFCHIIVVGGRVFASRLIHRRRCRL